MDYSFADILTLLGSLGLFLYGMKVMSDALMQVAGNKMRRILAKMTSNRIFSVFTGFLITTVIQSSSATTLMVVSFVNAGLLTLMESVGVIMGANIGTTVTAWLISILGFKVSMSALAIPIVGLGFLLSLSKKEQTKYWGLFTVGFAVLFIGLQFLKDSVPDIKNNPEILEWLTSYTDLGYLSVLLFLLIGTVLTVIIQSSSATMALTLVMCYEGWIPFDLAAAMVLGENIGTTITANLAALVADYNAKRTARAHLIFNLLGVLWMLILFYPFLSAIDWFVTRAGGPSPWSTPEAIPVALSTFHTTFNIINTFTLVWFIPLIVKIVERIVPATEAKVLNVDQPRYIDEAALSYPATAIEALSKESIRLFEGPVYQITAHGLNLHREDIESDLKAKKIIKDSSEIIEVDIDDLYYSRVKSIYGQILAFGSMAQSRLQLDNIENLQISNIKIANRYFVEAIKEIGAIQNNMDKYFQSDNKYIKKEYNKLRRKGAKVLRLINAIASSEQPTLFRDKLVALKTKVKQNDIIMDGTLGGLIRENLITPEMATSLANDCNVVGDLCSHLLSAAELLYIKNDSLVEEFIKYDVSKGKKKEKTIRA